MGRKIGTPCVGAPWILAPSHGTASAYNRHGCRCGDAVEARKIQRQPHETNAAGVARRLRARDAHRRARRGPDGLTATERRVRDRTARVTALLARPGATVNNVARALGVSERTIRKCIPRTEKAS